MNSQTLRIVYLYSLAGVPQYVGQSGFSRLRDRHKEHCTGNLAFDKFIKDARSDTLRLDILAACVDWPHGPLINSLENAGMDLYETYHPKTGKGWNFSRANAFEMSSAEKYEASQLASKAVRRLPEVRAKMRNATILASQLPTARKRNSDAKKQHWSDPELRAKYIASMTAAANRPDIKARTTAQLRAQQANPLFHIRRAEALRKPEFRELMSRDKKKFWADPESRERLIAAQNIGKRRPEVRLRKSISQKVRFSDPETRRQTSIATKAAMARPEIKARTSAAQKLRFEKTFLKTVAWG